MNGAIEAIKGRPPDARFPYDEPKQLFHNLRDGRFEDATKRGGAVFAVPEVSRGAAFGDIDNDGDTDVVISNIHTPARLLINQAANGRHWLGLRLVGGGARGRDMLGARVEVVRPTASRSTAGRTPTAATRPPTIRACSSALATPPA